MKKNPFFWIPILLMLAVVGVVFRDYGITWDEPTQHQYGIYVLRFYTSLLEDTSCLTYLDAYLYGGLFNLVAACAVELSPIGVFETRHLVNGLVGVVGIAGTWKLVSVLAGGHAATLTAVLLFLDPTYFGHMFNNPKDIPFAAGYVWSLYYVLRSMREFPALPRGLVIKLGLCIGLTLGVRIGGLVLLVYLALAAVACWIAPGLSRAHEPRPVRSWKSLTRSLAGVLAIAYAVMLAFWPWAQQSPLLRPFRALEEMSRFTVSDTGLLARVLLGGEYHHAMNLPATYLPHYMGVKLPELTLVGVALGVVLAVCYLVRTSRSKIDGPRVARFALLGTAIVAPVGYVILRESILYDTMRHFLFIVPCLYAVSGIALALAIRWLGGVDLRRRLLVHVAFLAALGPQLLAMIELHPHQYVYYNRIVGGVEGAQGRYEMDYWGNSYKEAVERLARHVETRESPLDAGGSIRNRFRVDILGPVASAAYYFPDYLEYTEDASAADFVITFTRWGLDRRVPGVRVASVERQGALLSVVVDVRGLRQRGAVAPGPPRPDADGNL